MYLERLKRYDPATDSHWMLRQRTGGAWLVGTTGGEVLAHVSVPDAFRLMSISGQALAGVVRDSLGVERVSVLRLETR